MLVDVHLDQLDLALGGLDDLFQDRGELLAGAAPGRPEVDQHRLALRLLDHVLHEALGGGLLDETLGGRRGCRSPPFSSIVMRSSPGIRTGPVAPGQHCSPSKWAGEPAIAIGSQASGSGPATGTIRGGWPVASRNFTRSSRAIEVVMVLTSGCALTMACSIKAGVEHDRDAPAASLMAPNGVTAPGVDAERFHHQRRRSRTRSGRWRRAAGAAISARSRRPPAR